MRVTFNFFCLIIVLALISCEKDELPVSPHDPGDIESNQLEMGNDYRHQIFYELKTNTIVRQNLKTDWDIGFEASENGWHIVLNSSTGGAAALTNETTFSTAIDINGLEWKWDTQTGNLDSTAIGDWREHQQLYVIDRGYDHLANHLGYRKILFSSLNNEQYQIRYSALNGENEYSVIILKDTSVNFVCFSFASNAVADIEPPKESWDLLFTQYIHIFKEPVATPYLVTGVLTNRSRIQTAIDKEKGFNNITYDNAATYTFYSNVNSIGYDWKTYSFDAGSYKVDPSINYILQTPEKIVYKLRFIDFYNELGDKGAPKFDVQAL